MDHADEAVGKPVLAYSDRVVHLEVPEHSLNAVTLLVERHRTYAEHSRGIVMDWTRLVDAW